MNVMSSIVSGVWNRDRERPLITEQQRFFSTPNRFGSHHQGDGLREAASRSHLHPKGLVSFQPLKPEPIYLATAPGGVREVRSGQFQGLVREHPQVKRRRAASIHSYPDDSLTVQFYHLLIIICHIASPLVT